MVPEILSAYLHLYMKFHIILTFCFTQTLYFTISSFIQTFNSYQLTATNQLNTNHAAVSRLQRDLSITL